MKTQVLAVSVLALVFSASPAVSSGLADRGPDEPIIVSDDQVKWQPGPGSLAPGAQFALIEGNPAEEGYFMLRIKMPDGFRIAPHTHPGVERLTVLSGTFRLGHGEQIDEETTMDLGAGSYFSMPPQMAHFAIAQGETVVQLASIGPWEIDYIDPADDPRLQAPE